MNFIENDAMNIKTFYNLRNLKIIASTYAIRLKNSTFCITDTRTLIAIFYTV